MPPDVFLPQPQDGGGGFWGGLLDVLRNVPITIGGPKSRIQLPSYNEMTAGRRLVDYGRAQGLDIPPTGSVSPGEGQFMIQEGLRRRQSAPLGMDVAQQFMPPQAGEGPEVMGRRAMLARMSAAGIPGLLGQIIATEGGLSSAPISLESMGITLPRRGESAPSAAPTPPPAAAPSPAPPAANRPARDVDAQFNTILSPQEEAQFQQWKGRFAPRDSGEDYDLRGAFKAGLQPDPTSGHWPDTFKKPNHPTFSTQSRYAAYGQPGQWQGETFIPPRAAPSTAPLATPQAQPPSVPTAAAMPPPPKPPGQVYMEDVENHPTVQAAKLAWARMPSNRKLQEAYYVAQAKAHQHLQAEHHRQYTEGSQEWRNQLAAQKEARDALRDQQLAAKALADAQRAPYGYGQEWDAQIRLKYQLPPGVMPTQEQAESARQDLQANQTAQKAAEAAATKQATLGAEATARSGLSLLDAVGGDPAKARVFRNPQTGYPLDPATPWFEARKAPQVTGKPEEQLDAQLDVMPIVQTINQMYGQLYGPGGLYERLTPAERTAFGQVGSRAWHQLNQDHPELEIMRAYIDTNAEPLARAVGGVRGAGTEADVQRAKAIFAEVGETFGFRMKGWIPTFQWNRPDTRAVALGKLNAFNQTLDKRTGNLLGNPQFEHPGLLPRMSLEQGTTEGQKTSGAIGPYQPEVGPQGLTPAQIKATPTRPPRTAQEAPGLSPTDAMQQVQQTSLKQHGLTRPPAAATQPAEFKAYMRTVRQQIGRYFPKKTPAQQEELTQLIAQKLGGTWP